MQTPGSSSKKTFNLRKATSLEVAADPKELLLDFGYRAWRLRASDAGEARRWLVLLEAGRLTAGPDGEESDSDASERSVVSVPSTPSTAATEPSTPKFGQREKEARREEMRSAPVIADALEVDAESLDQAFEEWLPAPQSANLVCDGLSRALQGLWKRLCDLSAAALRDESLRLEASRRRPPAAAERAVSSLLRGQHSLAARAALDHFLEEWLARVQRSLELWFTQSDPAADDVTMVAKWFLFQAEPSLLGFCSRAESFAGGALSSTGVVQIEQLLLREWESRSCEETSALCSYTFEGHYAEEAGRVPLAPLLRSLAGATAAWQTWRGHRDALQRASSVLIATLNAALRALQAASRALLAPRRKKTLVLQVVRELQKVGTCTEPKGKVSEELILAAAEDAAQLANFCTEANLEGWGEAQKLCQEVLSAFALAFRAVARQLATAWARRQASDAEPVALTRAPAPLEPVLRGALAVQQGRSYLRRLPRDLAALGRLEEVSRQLRSLAPEEPSFPRAAECLKSFLREGSWDGLVAMERSFLELMNEEEARTLSQALWHRARR